MDLSNKDLNLLVVFAAIWEHRNLSKVADQLYVSQSAISHSLRKLRTEFRDDIFVRDSRGVSPTEFAEQLAPKVLELVNKLNHLYNESNAFEPSSTTRELSLAVGDYFSVTLLTQFLKHLNDKSPGVKITCHPVSNVFNLEKFEKGEIHIGVSAIEIKPKEGFHLQELMSDKIAVCVRKNHRRVKSQPSMKTYLDLKHLVVSNFGNPRGVVDEQLESIGKKRDVNVVVSSFYDAAKVLENTDLVLSAPKRICDKLAEQYDLTVFKLPFTHKMRPISMIWHERTNKDPFFIWMREQILKLSQLSIQ